MNFLYKESKSKKDNIFFFVSFFRGGWREGGTRENEYFLQRIQI